MHDTQTTSSTTSEAPSDRPQSDLLLRHHGGERTLLPTPRVDSPDVSWRAHGSPGALGVLVTLCLALLLAAGQAPYDWAWTRGQHVTTAQWKAHERYEQRGVNHHGPTDSARSTADATAQVGTWLEDGTHAAHAPAPDGVQLRTDTWGELRPALAWHGLAQPPVALPRMPALSPPIQPPRFTS